MFADRVRKKIEAQSELPKVWVVASANLGDTSGRASIGKELNPDYKKIFLTAEERSHPLKFLERLKEEFGSMEEVRKHLPDIIIAGDYDRKFIEAIKQQTGGKTRSVLVIMTDNEFFKPVPVDHPYVTQHLAKFDVVVTYPFQNLTFEGTSKNLPPIVTIDCIPHFINRTTLEEAKKQWSGKLGIDEKKHPIYTLVAGGDIDVGEKLTAKMATELGKRVRSIAERDHAVLLSTTSPRTSEEATGALHRELEFIPGHFHRFTHDPSQKGRYPAMLATGDAIIVTADSMSMCGEAVATGKPVYIYTPKGQLADVHERYIQHLFDKGLAKPFEHLEQKGLEHWDYEPVYPTEKIVDKVKEVLQTRTLSPE